MTLGFQTRESGAERRNAFLEVTQLGGGKATRPAQTWPLQASLSWFSRSSTKVTMVSFHLPLAEVTFQVSSSCFFKEGARPASGQGQSVVHHVTNPNVVLSVGSQRVLCRAVRLAPRLQEQFRGTLALEAWGGAGCSSTGPAQAR